MLSVYRIIFVCHSWVLKIIHTSPISDAFSVVTGQSWSPPLPGCLHKLRCRPGARRSMTSSAHPSSTFLSVLPTSWHYHSIHYNDVIMGTIAYQITSLTIVYRTVYSDANQSEHQSSASLAFVRGIHRGPVNFPHKWPVTRNMFLFGDVIILRIRYLSYPWLNARL